MQPDGLRLGPFEQLLSVGAENLVMHLELQVAFLDAPLRIDGQEQAVRTVRGKIDGECLGKEALPELTPCIVERLAGLGPDAQAADVEAALDFARRDVDRERSVVRNLDVLGKLSTLWQSAVCSVGHGVNRHCKGGTNDEKVSREPHCVSMLFLPSAV